MAERFGGGSIQAGDDAAGDAADSAELSGGGNDQRVSLASGVSFETQVRDAGLSTLAASPRPETMGSAVGRSHSRRSLPS